MENILVSIFVPLIGLEYEAKIPINKTIGSIKKNIEKAIYDLSGGSCKIDENSSLINKKSGVVYSNVTYVIDSDIRNGTELIIF